jgi:hypothetical protein
MIVLPTWRYAYVLLSAIEGIQLIPFSIGIALVSFFHIVNFESEAVEVSCSDGYGQIIQSMQSANIRGFGLYTVRKSDRTKVFFTVNFTDGRTITTASGNTKGNFQLVCSID